MDPERWPEFIRMVVDQLGERINGILVEVDYQAPLWRLKTTCPYCRIHRSWLISAPPPKPEARSTPVPEWVRSVFTP